MTSLNSLRILKIKPRLHLLNSILLTMTKNTLIDSINYARKYLEITEEQYEIILACRKKVLKIIHLRG